MTGCDTHGELLGGYVLGALSTEETEVVRRHLLDCPACASEYAALASLPELLDRIEPSDVPPPVPPPALEEAVLDRWTREHRRARRLEAHGPGRRGRRSQAKGRGRRGRQRLGPVPIGRAAAAVLGALLIAAMAFALLPRDSDDPYAHGTLAGAQGADGSFTVERVSTGTRVYLEADRLPRDAYEVWCVRTDGRWISGGSFHANASGRAAVTLTAAVAPGDYHTVIVTRGTPEDGHGAEVMRGKLVY